VSLRRVLEVRPAADFKQGPKGKGQKRVKGGGRHFSFPETDWKTK